MTETSREQNPHTYPTMKASSLLIQFAIISVLAAAAFAQVDLSTFPVCSGTQSSYSCTSGGSAFATVQPSPADAQPAVGSPYTDPVFGSTIKRITPLSGQTMNHWGTADSPISPWSKDGTYALIYLSDGNFWLVNGSTYASIRKLQFGTSCTSATTFPLAGNNGTTLCGKGYDFSQVEAFWMFTNDDCFGYPSGKLLVKYCVSTDTTYLIHDFTSGFASASPAISSAQMKGIDTREYCPMWSDDDGKIVFDIHGTGSSWGANGDIIGWVEYNVATDTVVAVKTVGVGSSYDFNAPALGSNNGHACISPSGTYFQIGWINNTPTITATSTTISPQFSTGASAVFTWAGFAYQGAFDCNSGHADSGYDAAGNEVFVATCTNFGGNTTGLASIHSMKYSDRTIIEHPFDVSFHVGGASGCNSTNNCSNNYHVSMIGTRGANGKKGYAVISTQTEPTYPGTTTPDFAIAPNTSSGAFAQAEIFIANLTGVQTQTRTCFACTVNPMPQDAGTTYRIAHDQTIYTDYWTEAHVAAAMNGGKKLMFESTWRTNQGSSPFVNADAVNAFVIELPTTSTSPAPAPVPFLLF